jgi:molybdopterin converting factor small subunit
MAKAQPVEVRVRLLPPLSTTAGRESVKLRLAGDATIQGIIDALIERFDTREFRHHLYDTDGRLIPAWCVFVNEEPVSLNSRKGTQRVVKNGDEITFLLNVAGGSVGDCRQVSAQRG